jgi:CheY-like chemotaxis protein
MVKKSRVLVVDDEKNIRLTIAQSLENMAVEVDTAVNGRRRCRRSNRRTTG